MFHIKLSQAMPQISKMLLWDLNWHFSIGHKIFKQFSLLFQKQFGYQAKVFRFNNMCKIMRRELENIKVILRPQPVLLKNQGIFCCSYILGPYKWSSSHNLKSRVSDQCTNIFQSSYEYANLEINLVALSSLFWWFGNEIFLTQGTVHGLKALSFMT